VIKQRWKNWAGTERPGRRAGVNGVLHLAAADSQEIAAGSRRTDIYDKIGKFLKLPGAKAFEAGRRPAQGRIEEKPRGPTQSLFKEVRELFFRNANTIKNNNTSDFEKQPFGELERLVTEKL